LLGGGKELIAGEFGFLLIEEGDAEIQAGHCKFWVGLKSLLKKFLGVGGALLVEVSDAEGVQAQRLCGIVGWDRLGRLRGCCGLGSFLGRTRWQKYGAKEKQASEDRKNGTRNNTHVDDWCCLRER